MTKQYKIITLCGSIRFKEDFLREQTICTLEGRKNTLSLDVKTVQDDEGLPIFFHNQYFAEVDEIGKNPFQRGVLHRRTSKTPESN